MNPLRRLATIVHPSRDLTEPLAALRDWAEGNDVELTQIHVRDEEPDVAPEGESGDADVIVALGGDGTVLSALRTGAGAKKPVLGIACGSLGALAAVPPDGVRRALDRVASGDWGVHELPALEIRPQEDDAAIDALNDIVVVRAGAGQLRVSVALDGVAYGRWGGDGVILATAVGSSAYTMAAGGPLLAPGTVGSVLTPLSPHGGFIPPLVAAEGEVWTVDIHPGFGGARIEVDGQPSTMTSLSFEAELRGGYARLIRLGDEEPFLGALRRRGLVADSPRVLVEEARERGGT